jgi:hypothetical protein
MAARNSSGGTRTENTVIPHKPKMIRCSKRDEFNLEAIAGRFFAQPISEFARRSRPVQWVAVMSTTMHGAGVEQFDTLLLRKDYGFDIVGVSVLCSHGTVGKKEH